RESESGAADESTKIVKRRSARLRRSSEESESESTPMPSNGRPPTTPQPIIVVRSARKTDQLGTSKATASNDIKEESESNELRYPMRARTTRRDSTIRGSSQGEPRDKRESQASSSGGALSKLGLINQAMRAHKDFKRLVSMCSSRWGKKYWLRKRSDPDKSVKDYEVDVEVETRKGEGYKFWDAMYAKAGTNEGYEIDYIVGTVMRLIGEEITKICLIKFTKYPVCSWEERKRIRDGNEIKMYRIRCFELDFIEIRLRIEIGDAEFEKSYPNRYLKEEKGEGDGGYVTNQRSLYHNDLRALESRWAYICARAGLPTLYIEDWTNEPFGLKSLMELEFMVYLVNSPFVADFIKGYDQLKGMKCEPACSSCTRKNHRDGQARENSEETSFDVDQRTGEFQWCKKRETRHNEHCIHFECTDDCSCGETCRNRHVQRGRQMVLCVFRQPGKGWGVRAVSEIDQCKFVTEYIGEVNEKGMSGGKSVYDFEMAYSARDREGKEVHKKFIISAGKKGNESRFFNHSCTPNMNPMTTIIERYGLFYNHVSFFTNRKILPGEELVFDYFPDKDSSDIDISRMFPNGCQCISSECRFPHKSAAYNGTSVEWDKEDVNEEEEEDGMGEHDVPDLMIADDDDFGGASMRDENEDGANDDSSPVHSPPARRKSTGSENRKKSRRSKMEESDDDDDEEKAKERRDEAKRRKRMGGGEERQKSFPAPAVNEPPRNAPPDPSRLARKAVGTG
ncbi:hypothetical protein PENTCL1PPCAC_21880, partial [Pristionchus entomophagus]